jgi:hypothetical protein
MGKESLADECVVRTYEGVFGQAVGEEPWSGVDGERVQVWFWDAGCL